MTAFPKQLYIRSKALLEACRLIPCQWCGVSDGSVVAAHSNWSQHGKGRGIKASDSAVASLCHECHSALDQGRLTTKEQRQQAWWSAHIHTVRELVDRQLWPKSVPVPDTTVNPFDLTEKKQINAN
jgi:hypothetical protein